MARGIANIEKAKVKDFKKAFKFLFDNFKQFKASIIISSILAIISGLSVAIAIYLYGLIFNVYFDFQNPPEWKSDTVFLWFTITVMGLLTTYIINNLFNWLSNFLFIKLSEKGCYNIRNNIFRKIQRIPIKYFDQTPSGEIMSRVANDVDNISIFFTQYIANIIYYLSCIVSLLITMFLFNWALSLITMIIYPLLTIVTSQIVKRIRPYFIKQQKTLGSVNAFIEEYVSGTKIISLFKMEEKSLEKFEKVNKELTKQSIVGNAFSNVLMPIGIFFNNISFVILTGMGMSFVILGWIKTSWGVVNFNVMALLMMYTLFSNSLTNPINQLIQSIGQMVLTFASCERIFEIFLQDEEQDSLDAINLKDSHYKIEARNLSFGYDPNKLILKNISFEANPGTITALVGPTGAGKTTITNLITKFYPITKGNLYIDNIPFDKVRTEWLRKNITIVLQDTFLFSTSIKENIRYGNLQATDEEIYQAAKLANADQFIKLLPNGYDTILKDNGEDLSQGQRQLLALARAFLSKAKIIILDEATSSIDTKTELLIKNAMEKLIKNKTAFIIAHRLSTIENADNILVIKDGQIIESGTHKKLIAKKGFYYQLHNSQFKGEEI